jgi:archaetidylinositol phosphate synthase
MLDHWLVKSKFKESYEKFIQNLFRDKFTANQLTISGLFSGLICAFFIFLSGLFKEYFFLLYLISIIMMVISFIFDTFDGPVARLRGKTKFGGYLDMFCDRLVEISIIIAFASTNPNLLMYPALFSLGSMVLCISIFLLSGIESNVSEGREKIKVIYFKKGFIERSETFIFLLLIDLLYALRSILLWVFAISILITAFLRLINAFRELGT